MMLEKLAATLCLVLGSVCYAQGRPVHIDSDMGVDDAFAIAYVLAHDELQLVGLSTVFGNVHAAQAARNAGIVLDHCGAAAELRPSNGCEGPMIKAHHFEATWPGHGPNGLGGADYPVSKRLPGGVHAAIELIENSHHYSGLEILAIGPLSNVALAYLLDPSLPERVERLVIMGGADSGRGNATPSAEFNFRCDPEAAAIVLEAFAGKIELVSWELTLKTPLAWEWLSDDCPDFLQSITGPYRDCVQSLGQAVMCDLVAAYALAHPERLEYQTLYAEVLCGSDAQGALLIDWYGMQARDPSIHLIQSIDLETFRASVAEHLGCQDD